MNEPVNVTRAALVKLLDAVPYPNPDDPGDPSPPWGPYGPIGPVIGGVLRGLSRVLLNPQPLPPRDRGTVQKILGRFRTSTSARREEVVYGNAGRLGFGVLLVLVIISLAFWLLRRRTRGETAPMPVEAEEGVEEAVRLEEEEEASPSKDIRSIIRESVTTSGAGSRGEEESQAESTAPEQSRRAGDEELPIEDYDSLNVKQISERLAELSDE